MIKKRLTLKRLDEVDEPRSKRDKVFKDYHVKNTVTVKNDEPTENETQFKATTKMTTGHGNHPSDPKKWDLGKITSNPDDSLPVTKIREDYEYTAEEFAQLDESVQKEFYKHHHSKAMEYSKIISGALKRHGELIGSKHYSDHPDTYHMKDVSNRLADLAQTISSHVHQDEVEVANRKNYMANREKAPRLNPVNVPTPSLFKEEVEPAKTGYGYVSSSTIIRDLMRGRK